MKSYISLVCLLLVASVAVECRPKRSILVAAPVVAHAAVVPTVHTASVVHANPTTVVKTEQVHSGAGTSYSYSTETKAVPVVHHHTATAVAAAPAAVATVAHVPATYAANYGYYPSYYSPYYYASPYHYVVGK